jgi:hypothetical protein
MKELQKSATCFNIKMNSAFCPQNALESRVIPTVDEYFQSAFLKKAYAIRVLCMRLVTHPPHIIF